MPAPCIVVGSANADLFVHCRLPLPGETICATGGGEVLPGGKGANQAAAAARLCCPTVFVGQTGRDGAGAMLREQLAASGVLLEHTAEVAGPTGQAVILLQPDGENSIILVPGANAAWTTPQDHALDAVRSAGLLLLQREVPESVSLAAARAAHAAGVPVVLDAGGDEQPICAELLACITYLSPNETELARLTGLPTEGEAGVLAACAALHARGVEHLLVKLGASGSLLSSRGAEPVRQPAFRAPQVVDTTGAGDCFTAAFAVGLLEGLAPPAAMRFASAAACLCVQARGAMPSLPRRPAVDALLAAQ